MHTKFVNFHSIKNLRMIAVACKGSLSRYEKFFMLYLKCFYLSANGLIVKVVYYLVNLDSHKLTFKIELI